QQLPPPARSHHPHTNRSAHLVGASRRHRSPPQQRTPHAAPTTPKRDSLGAATGGAKPTHSRRQHPPLSDRPRSSHQAGPQPEVKRSANPEMSARRPPTPVQHASIQPPSTTPYA